MRYHVGAHGPAPAASWIAPASEGKRPATNRLTAHLHAWRLTRQLAADRTRRLAAARTNAERSIARLPAMTAHARRIPDHHRKA